MRKLALPVMALAALGTVSLFLAGPQGSLWHMYKEFDPWRLGVALVGFTAAGAVAALSLRGPRAHGWQSLVVLGAFAVVLFKFRAWRLLLAFGNSTMPAKLLAISIFGGIICALFATFLPNDEETLQRA